MALDISSKLKWIGYGAIICGYAAVYFDQSALSVALPYIQNDLHASEFQLHWIINIYLLTLSLFVLTGGRLADMIGMRKIFLTGCTIFSFASIACAIAPSAISLICFRALQGVGSALLLPVSQGSIYHIFSGKERGKALGVFGISGGVFLVLGPIIGGLFTQFVTWRWIFWINPMLGCVGFFGVYFILKGLDQDKNSSEKFDLIGLVLFCLAFAPLIFGLMQGQSWGFNSASIITLLAISPVFFILFFWMEKRRRYALLNLALFKKNNFTIGTLLFICIQFAFISTIFFAIFLQKGVGFKPFITGIALLPTLLMTPVLSVPIGNFSNHASLKLIIRIGFIILFIAFLWLFFVSKSLSYGWIVVGFVLFGIGVPFAVLGTYRLMMEASAKDQQGATAGISMLARQMGGTIGIALMSIAINYFLMRYSQISNLQTAYTKGFTSLLVIVMVVLLIGLFLSFKIEKNSQLKRAQ